MNIAYKGISQFYTGTTSTLNFTNVPITLTKDDFVLSFVISCSTGLTESIPYDWFLIDKIGNNSPSGTTFIFKHQPTGTTVNPTWQISGLSNNLNGGYIMVFSGCTKNTNKVINNHQSQGSAYSTLGGGSLSPSRNNTMLISAIGAFGNTNVNLWYSTPSLTWNVAGQSGITFGGFEMTLGVAYSNNVNANSYNLQMSLNDPAVNNSHNVALAVKQTNVVISISQN